VVLVRAICREAGKEQRTAHIIGAFEPAMLACELVLIGGETTVRSKQNTNEYRYTHSPNENKMSCRERKRAWLGIAGLNL
jgi:hypothetical protein